ncbi:MAG: hypothetical protein CUN57_01220, partial [Phototrophicales bacterium]
MKLTATGPCGSSSGTGTLNALPIDLVRFVASKRDGGQVSLEWTTASEINNDYFTIERSFDGRNFESIGQVKGAGNSFEEINYSFVDESIAGISSNRIVYYRLKQTDYDGVFTYSDVISVELGESKGFDIIEIFEEQSQIKVHFNAPSEG